MMKYMFTLALVLGFSVWATAQKKVDKKAQKIIQECVAVHGGKSYQNFDVSFDFRKYKFKIKNNGSFFRFERSTQDSTNREIIDVLSNDGFVRTINGEKQTLVAKEEDRTRESVNSVAYFMMLPYKLTDAAVNSAYLGTITIDNQVYDKIKVWFDAQGGGKDFQDVFCYWINQKTHTLDYLAYGNGGPRFRKATKRETVSGIIFQDYENYEILDKTAPTFEYDKAFLEGKSKLLSKIEQTNYKANR